MIVAVEIRLLVRPAPEVKTVGLADEVPEGD